MSSKLTSADIIAEGRYLEADFDPSTLTVAQLLGVFGFHNINYPTTYTKPKLVQLFNDEIKAHAKKLKKERLSRQNSLASEDGITDGHTGKPLSESKSVSKCTFLTVRFIHCYNLLVCSRAKVLSQGI